VGCSPFFFSLAPCPLFPFLSLFWLSRLPLFSLLFFAVLPPCSSALLLCLAIFLVSLTRLPFAQSSLSKDQIQDLQKQTHFDNKELQAMFKQFKKETPSGLIGKTEFKTVMQQMGVSDEFLQDLIFQVFDENGDGNINFQEFVTALSVMTRGDPNEKLECAFPGPSLCVPSPTLMFPPLCVADACLSFALFLFFFQLPSTCTIWTEMDSSTRRR
jgi:EF hand